MTLPELDYDDRGLVPAIVQEADTGEVLMLGYMDATALKATFDKGLVTFWSRSRQEYWTKGDTSGNRLHLVEIRYDCEGRSLLVRARLEGDAVCHTGNRVCYFRTIQP